MQGLNMDDLTNMSPPELRAAWHDQFRKPGPDIGPDLLRLLIVRQTTVCTQDCGRIGLEIPVSESMSAAVRDRLTGIRFHHGWP